VNTALHEYFFFIHICMHLRISALADKKTEEGSLFSTARQGSYVMCLGLRSSACGN